MLTEIFDAPQILETVNDPASPHLARIRGTVIREGARSGNRREYANTAAWLAKAQAKIDGGGTLDIRTHHEAGDRATEIVGRVTTVRADGTYEAQIVNNDTGRQVLPLIAGGYLKHVSLRAKNATVEPMEASEPGWIRVTDLDLCGIDFTNNPGIAEASVSLAECAGDEITMDSFGMQERDFSADQRKGAAASGAAMPDGSYPVENEADLKNAILAIGRAKDPAAVKAHITRRAAALGLSHLIPDTWKHPKENDMTGIADAINDAAEHLAENTPIPTPEAAEAVENAASIAEAINSAKDALADNSTNPFEGLAPEEAILKLAAGLAEAGKPISGANMTHLKAAHDHLTTVMGGCDPENADEGPGEAAPAAPVTEPLDIKTLVTEAVLTAVADERATFEERIAAERKAAVEEVLSARRKTALAPDVAESEIQNMTLGQAVAAAIGTR